VCDQRQLQASYRDSYTFNVSHTSKVCAGYRTRLTLFDVPWRLRWDNFTPESKGCPRPLLWTPRGNSYIGVTTLSADFQQRRSFSNRGQLRSFPTLDLYQGEPDRSALVYSTYFSYTGASGAVGIAVRRDWNAYVTGEALPAVSTTANAFAPAQLM